MAPKLRRLGPLCTQTKSKYKTTSQTSSIRFQKQLANLRTIFCFSMPRCQLLFSPCTSGLHGQDLSCGLLNMFAFNLGPGSPHITSDWGLWAYVQLPNYQITTHTKTGNSTEHYYRYFSILYYTRIQLQQYIKMQQQKGGRFANGISLREIQDHTFFFIMISTVFHHLL